MEIYAFISEKFQNSCLISILTSDGELLDKFEVFSIPKGKAWAEERARRYSEKRGYRNNFDWVDNPWEHEGVKVAKINYERTYFVPFTGSTRN